MLIAVDCLFDVRWIVLYHIKEILQSFRSLPVNVFLAVIVRNREAHLLESANHDAEPDILSLEKDFQYLHLRVVKVRVV